MELYLRGIKLFNSHAYFEAHEVLEDVWRAALGREKKFLQGLIQVAVALHHHSKGNVVGARSLLARAEKNLSGYPDDFAGIQLPELLYSLAQWQHALAENKSLPPLPRFVVNF
jgi:predicted metal-dependent hydrolase